MKQNKQTKHEHENKKIINTSKILNSEPETQQDPVIPVNNNKSLIISNNMINML